MINKKSLSKYTSDWSARIEFLKQSLSKEAQLHERAPEQNSRPEVPSRVSAPASPTQMDELTDKVKHLQETAAHEVRNVSKRCQELEEFVKAKEIDLQNLKSESVENRLVHDEIRQKLELQTKKWQETGEEMEKNIQDLTNLVSALKQQIKDSKVSQPSSGEETASIPTETSQVPIFVLPEDKSLLKRCLEWWNEPV